MGNLFDSEQTNELAKLMSEQQKLKLRKAIAERLLEEKQKEEQSLNEEVVEPTPPEEDLSGTARYVKAMRDLNEKKSDNRQKVIREKNDLLAGDESVTAAQLRQANQDLWNRVQTSLASLGGGGLGERDVIALVKKYSAEINLDSDDLAAIIPGVLDGLTTDEVPEGIVNLYFTEQRVWQSLSSGDGISQINNGTGELSIDIDELSKILLTGVNWDSAFSEAFDSFQNLSTTDSLPEGQNNLYYTTARHDSDTLVLVDSDYVNRRVKGASAAVDSAEVIAIIEETVDSEFVNALVDLAEIPDPLNSTDSLPEGSTNLYYTSERVEGVIDSYVDNAFLTGKIALDDLSDVDASAPSTNQFLQYNGAQWEPADIDLAGGVDFKGTINAVDSAAPADPANGDMYINIASGPADASWTGLTTVDSDQQLIWGSDQASWFSIGGKADAGVVEVREGTAVNVDATDASRPTVSVDKAVTDTWYYTQDSVDAIISELQSQQDSLTSELIDSATINELIDIRIDSANFVLKAGDTMTGDLTLAADPTADLHAATKQYVDNLTSDTAVDSAEVIDIIEELIDSNDFVHVSGDTMTGPLTLYADPVANMHAATKQYVDEQILGAFDSATGGFDSGFFEDLFVSKGGDSMGGPLFSAGDPTDDLEFANKRYVDNQITTVVDSAYVNARVDLQEIPDVPDPLNSTDSLPEGVTNLYYTDGRVEALVDSAYVQARVEFPESIILNTTDSLAEGVNNLYYTDSRVENKILSTVDSAYVNERVDLSQIDNPLNTTDSLAEGAINLYYTSARNDSDTTALVDSAYVNARVDLSQIPDPLNSTDSLAEGSTNLYYTSERVEGVIDSYVDNAFLTDKLALDDLSDVTSPAPTSGEFLKYNGAAWVPATFDVDAGISFKGTINAVDSAAPADPANGDMYINTGSGTADASWTGLTTVDSDMQLLWGSDQQSWFSIGGAGTPTGVQTVQEGTAIDVDATDAENPTVSVDKAVTDTWYYTQDSVDAMFNALPDSTQVNDLIDARIDSTQFVQLAGDTMTGFLKLHADPDSAMDAVTKQYVDAVSDNFDSDEVIAIIDERIDSTQFVQLAGDSMTGFLTLHANPVDSMQAATKDYVDSKTYATGDLTDVNDSAPKHGQILMYDSAAGMYNPVDIEQAGGGVAHYDSIPPELPFTNGQFWFSTQTTSLYVWHENAWVKIGL